MSGKELSEDNRRLALSFREGVIFNPLEIYLGRAIIMEYATIITLVLIIALFLIIKKD